MYYLKDLMDNFQDADVIYYPLPEESGSFCEIENNLPVCVHMPKEDRMKTSVVCAVDQLDDLLTLTEAIDEDLAEDLTSLYGLGDAQGEVRKDLLCVS